MLRRSLEPGLYLLVAIFGTFAIAFVQGKVYVPGDAATTAGNVVANSGLVRIGVVADLFQATVFVFLGMTLYQGSSTSTKVRPARWSF